MKLIKFFTAFLVIIILASWFKISSVSDEEKEELIQTLIYTVIRSAHYENVVFDDVLSERFYREFIKFLDPQNLFFLSSDLKEFSKYKFNIDDQIRQGKLDFFNLVYERYLQRLKEAKEICNELEKYNFDLNKDEYLNIDTKSLNYPKNKKQKFDTWRKYIKYQILIKVDAELKRQKKLKQKNDTAFVEKPLNVILDTAKKEVFDLMKDYFDRLKERKREDIFSIYMIAITNSIDPHTVYMQPKIKEDFDISISGQLEGIGATLQQKDGKIKIVSLVPGGPAWKHGGIEPGDIILKVAQGQKGKWVSIVGMPISDAVRLIRGKKGTKVRLMIEKQDGTISEITIIRDRIILEDSYIRSVIITDSTQKYKIGYIYIPSFYADFQKNSRRVSVDFLKELKKMQNEKVDGLIIDLRNNSGGSLPDVIKCVGYLISKGPVVQVKDKDGNIRIETDKDKNIYFYGNVLVMTNYFSASASEIFAAAIQDYRRGLIFGTNHTHGKGTVQTVYDLDQIFTVPKKFKPLGALKLTVAKFYRINGGATQLKGVTPDIVYPNVFSYSPVGEKELDYPLPWDKIKPAKYNIYSYHYILDSVKQRSIQRMKKDSLFIYADRYAKFIAKDEKDKLIPLSLEKYREYQNQVKQYSKPYNKFKKRKNHLVFNYTSEDKKIMQTDTIFKERYDHWIKKLKKDHILEEAYRVAKDMKKFEKY